MGTFLFHGKIWQGNGQFADAVIIRRGRIAAIGRQEELYPLAGDCSFIDCGGRTVIPGIFDACISLAAAFSPLPEGKQGLDTACRLWMIAHPRQAKKGAHLCWHSAGERLSLAEMDAIWPSSPLVLEDVAEMRAWANSAALQRLEQQGIPASAAPNMTFDGEGKPHGEFYGKACRLVASVIPRLTQGQLKTQVRDWLQRAGQAGVTTVQSVDLDVCLDKKALPVLRQLYREQAALPRLQFWCPDGQPLPYRPPQAQRRWPAFAGRVTGLAELPFLRRQGGQMAVPIQSRQALETLLEHLRAHPLPPENPRRLTVLGAACTGPGQLQEMGQLALGVVAFPHRLERSLAQCAGQPGVRLETCCAWRTLSHLGAKVAFGGLDRCAPFAALQKAVCRKTVGLSGADTLSRETLTVEEALTAQTCGAAWMDFHEDSIGRLAPGWQADLLVLDRDILTCPAEELAETHPVLTMAAGQTLWREI